MRAAARGRVSPAPPDPPAPPECSKNGDLYCFYNEFCCFARPELAPGSSGSPGDLCAALAALVLLLYIFQTCEGVVFLELKAPAGATLVIFLLYIF